MAAMDSLSHIKSGSKQPTPAPMATFPVIFIKFLREILALLFRRLPHFYPSQSSIFLNDSHNIRIL